MKSVYDQQFECALIGAKTRVALLKNLSIPRLEFQAAVSSARFAKPIIDSHNFKIPRRVFWSDSRNVLVGFVQTIGVTDSSLLVKSAKFLTILM